MGVTHRQLLNYAKRIARQSMLVMAYASLFALLPIIAIVRLALRCQSKYRLRSVWTGAPIITMTQTAAAEKLLGFESITIVRSTYFITNKFDLNISAIAQQQFRVFIVTYALFIWICTTVDRVHAYTDGGLLPPHQRFSFRPLELFFYWLLRVKLFTWTYGADVRTRAKTLALGQPNCCTDCVGIKSSCVCDEEEAAKNYRRVAKVATAMFSMGDMIEYAPNSHTQLFFWPIDFARDNGDYYRPQYPKLLEHQSLRIVHAPNHRHFKGTQYLETAVNELKNEGIAIELVLVERVPNEQALEIYRSADVIFDQCLIGFHGYFAIEAMALGKPVMCFIRDPEKYLLHPQQCPLLNIHRDDLKQLLRHLATCERQVLQDIGQRSRAYVEQYHSLDAFAKRLKKCYESLGVGA